MSTWQVQTAKAKFSELLRAVREHGPQTITVRGKEEFVISSIESAHAAHPASTPTTWAELFESARGIGEDFALPPRELAEPQGVDFEPEDADPPPAKPHKGKR